MILDVFVVRSRPDREPFGIGPRVGRIERQVRVESERAVFIDLRDSPELGEVVPEPKLHVVVTLLPGKEPRVVILNLIVGIPRALRLGAGLRQEALIAELGRTEGLIADGLFSPGVACLPA